MLTVDLLFVVGYHSIPVLHLCCWYHCLRSLPISDTLQAGFEPVQNLSSGLVEWSCAVVITTTPQHHHVAYANCGFALCCWLLLDICVKFLIVVWSLTNCCLSISLCFPAARASLFMLFPPISDLIYLHLRFISPFDMVSDEGSTFLGIKYSLISLLPSSTLKLMYSVQSLWKFSSSSAKSCISSSCRFSASFSTIITDWWRNLSVVLLPLSSINCYMCVIFLVINSLLPAHFHLNVLTLSSTLCPSICSYLARHI